MELDECKQVYEQYKDVDPYPKVKPSLLNKLDIIKYVEKVGMIYPFHLEDLKGITYEARLKGDCIYWTEKTDGTREEHRLNIGNKGKKEMVIQPNSVVFVTLEPYFQIPSYIALRYNFKINQIYKGLLLGTGPIIDPGFHGHLSIPIHNLTKNQYTLYEEEALISIEFTKVNPYDAKIYGEKLENDFKKTKSFLGERNVVDYIHDALDIAPHGDNITTSENFGILNSIPGLNERVEEAIKSSQNHTISVDQKLDDFHNRFKDIERKERKSFIATIVVTLLSLIITLVLGTWALAGTLDSIHKERVSYTMEIQELQQHIDDLVVQINELETKVDGENYEKAELQIQINDLKLQIEQLQTQLDILQNKNNNDLGET